MPGPSSPTSIVVSARRCRRRSHTRPVGRRVADRVVEQVREHLVQPLGVAGGLEVDRARRSIRSRTVAARRARTRAPPARAARARRSARRSSGSVADSSRERSSSCSTSRPSRSRLGERGRIDRDRVGSTPSTRFSSSACSAPIGVRSSCETLATRSRRIRSTSARSAAIALNARASSPTSSRDVARHAPLVVAARHRRRGRRPSRAAARSSRARGPDERERRPRARHAARAATARARARRRTPGSPWSPTTAATITTPSLALIDGRKSSGLIAAASSA